MAALLTAPGASYHLAGWGWALEAVVIPCPPNLFPSWGDFLFLQDLFQTVTHTHRQEENAPDHACPTGNCKALKQQLLGG